MGGGGVSVRLGEEEVLPGVVGDQLNKEALVKSSSVNLDVVASGLSKVRR